MDHPDSHGRLSVTVGILLTVFLLLSSSGIPLAASSPSADKGSELPYLETEFGLSLGYRVDDVDWNIAGDINGNNPDVLSELTWEDMEIFQIKGDAKIIFTSGWYLRGSLSYGSILAGDNQDSDFAGDNRTQEWSRSNNNADDGSVWDASMGVGYQFRLASDRFRITPLVGYSYHEQNLTMTDGVQTVSKPALAPAGITPPALGPFAGLDNTYETQWYGLWAGLDLLYLPSERLALVGSFEYHWADYEAEANWNLRADFAHPKSFEHEADGDGIVVSLGCNYILTAPLVLYLVGEYQDWSTDPGIDRTFSAGGTASETRLNEVNWRSYSVMVGLAYRF